MTSSASDLLDRLNPQQREAAIAADGPLLVIAGAGSGKTRVIAHRVAHLIRERGVHPRRIFAATFTNKAASEMRHRVHALLDGSGSALPLSINTFHALCSIILRAHAPLVGLSKQFIIADESDSRSCMRDALRELNISKEEINPQQALWVVSQCKMRLKGSEAVGQVINTTVEAQYVQAFERYQRLLRSGDAADFDDLIGLVVRLFEENPSILEEYQDRCEYLLVDEYQDTNHAQFRLVTLLGAKHRNVCVVGDEDQSIYSWRGADLTNLLDFQKHYPGARLVKLEQNYRSTGNVLAAAGAVIARNKERIGKTLWTSIGDGLPIGLLTAQTDRQEAERICWIIKNLVKETGYEYRDIALFYRVNWLSRVYEDMLRDHDIPYQVIGGASFYERTEVRDLVSYLQFAANPHANLAFLRIINKPRRGVGQKTLDDLMEAAALHGRSLYSQVEESVANGELRGKARAALALLAEVSKDWVSLATKETPSRVLRRILDDTGYRESLGDEASLEARSRLENIEQLEASLVSFEMEREGAKLPDWLESVALASAQDDLKDGDAVSLMSLHAAKGLEYPVVFMAGMEDPIFPNQRAVRERGNDEEERRLFYVGITRAMRMLVLSRAETRVAYGELRFHQPSPFLRDVPSELIEPAEMIDFRRIDKAAQQGARGSRQALEKAFAAQMAKAAASSSGRQVVPDNSQEARVAATLRRFGGTPASPSPQQRDAEERHWTPDHEEESSNRAEPRRRPEGFPIRGAGGFTRGTGTGISGSSSTAPKRPAPRQPTFGNFGRAGASKPTPTAASNDPLAWARIGTRVQHDIFGAGLVVGESGSGPGRRVLVEFDEDKRQREMLASHAKLQPEKG
jgi:DNA helicase-2/ATP-dependent DNA helicase PcrA